jgi:hypothetical protein
VGFGGECGGSRAARAHCTYAWVYNRRIKQLARMEGDWAARTTALGTADAAKEVIRQEHCWAQPRATIDMSRTPGPCGRPAAEAAEWRRTAPVLKPHPHSLGFRWSSFEQHKGVPCTGKALVGQRRGAAAW